MSRNEKKPGKSQVRIDQAPALPPHSEGTERAAQLALDYPPHNEDAERAALGCVLLQAISDMTKAYEMMPKLALELFYTGKARCLYSLLADAKNALVPFDLVTLGQRIKDAGVWEQIGTLSYVSATMDACVSQGHFPWYVNLLKHQANRRKILSVAASLKLAATEDRPPEEIEKTVVEATDELQITTTDEKSPVVMMKASELVSFVPPSDMCLVGDTDITRGGALTILAGPPGCGKSTAADYLAIAGALGKGCTWLNRQVHSHFRTMVIQAENGKTRLKKLVGEIMTNFPQVKLDDYIRWTAPPDGGLPFGRPDFRRAIRQSASEFKPQVVVVDPWTAISMDTGASDVIDALALIRGCFASGDDAPAFVVVAHTRKTGEKGVPKGRNMLHELSGSLALGGSARCVYMLHPFTDDITDNRVILCCVKLSDSDKAPANSVWERKFGNLWSITEDDPNDFWDTDKNSGPQYTKEHLAKIFQDQKADDFWNREEIAQRIVKEFGGGISTARRYVSVQLAQYLEPLASGSKYFRMKT